MKIGRVSTSITPEEREKIGHLPIGANAYLEIPEADVAPAVGEDGEMYYNTTDNKFYMVEDAAWIEVLFSMEPVTE
ncbi:hypothetical protein ES708_12566 [subsurface metagenome]